MAAEMGIELLTPETIQRTTKSGRFGYEKHQVGEKRR